MVSLTTSTVVTLCIVVQILSLYFYRVNFPRLYSLFSLKIEFLYIFFVQISSVYIHFVPFSSLHTFILFDFQVCAFISFKFQSRKIPETPFVLSATCVYIYVDLFTGVIYKRTFVYNKQFKTHYICPAGTADISRACARLNISDIDPNADLQPSYGAD